jgi:hypothetical protein
MNKKTFSVAMIFLIVTVLYLGFELFSHFYFGHPNGRGLVLPILFVVAAAVMAWREFHRKKRKHVEDVKKYL